MAQGSLVRITRLNGADLLDERLQVIGGAHALLQLFAQPQDFERHRDLATEARDSGPLLSFKRQVADEYCALHFVVHHKREQLDLRAAHERHLTGEQVIQTLATARARLRKAARMI